MLNILRAQPETVAAGTRWTPEEERHLIDSLKTDKEIDCIAKEHRRTYGGITSRVRDIAVRMITDGRSIEEICLTLRMSPEEIEEAVIYTAKKTAINTARKEQQKIVKQSKQKNKAIKQWYFITVRPKPGIDFYDFKSKVESFVERKVFNEYTYSFEQKGTCDEDLGKGFHVHIVADCTWMSKGEALRDTQSSFAKFAADNCIEVYTTKGPETLIKKYLVEYHAEDGHKIITKVWDDKWRDAEGLKNIYRCGGPVWSAADQVTASKTKNTAPSSSKPETELDVLKDIRKILLCIELKLLQG